MPRKLLTEWCLGVDGVGGGGGGVDDARALNSQSRNLEIHVFDSSQKVQVRHQYIRPIYKEYNGCLEWRFLSMGRVDLWRLASINRHLRLGSVLEEIAVNSK